MCDGSRRKENNNVDTKYELLDMDKDFVLSPIYENLSIADLFTLVHSELLSVSMLLPEGSNIKVPKKSFDVNIISNFIYNLLQEICDTDRKLIFTKEGSTKNIADVKDFIRTKFKLHAKLVKTLVKCESFTEVRLIQILMEINVKLLFIKKWIELHNSNKCIVM